MGQCVSSKAVAAGAHNSQPMSRPLGFTSKVSDEVKESKRPSPYTRGVASSFGFRKRPETAIPVVTDNSSAQRKQLSPDSVDSNGNDDNAHFFESGSSIPSGRSTPRLAPPKKEASATRVSRFGFRQPNTRMSRVPDTNALANLSNAASNTTKFKNNNVEKPRAKGGGKTVTIAPTVPKLKLPSTADSTKNKNAKSTIPQSCLPTKYTLHSSQLPKPQFPVRVMETKTAKTAANINRKVSTSQRSDEGSSKEGSITGDSGVGSQTSGTNGNGETDTLHGVELLDSSPHFGMRRNSNRARNLEMVVSGKNFDVRDLDDDFVEDGVVTEVAVIPLPRLPSVFGNNISSGIVRERTREYQRQLDKNNSTESFDEYGEEEKSFRDISSNEKSRQMSSILFSLPTSGYRESISSGKDSSPPSSDEQDWAQGGEAMLDTNFYHFSSSDESKDRDRSPIPVRKTSVVSPVMDSNLMSMSGSYTGAIPKNPPKSVMLTIEDPFAAVAAKGSVTLLDDETSPQDSLISSFTLSEDILGNSVKKVKNSKSSGSKDINEKSPLSPTSPGTSTNTSLSLSEGRDFLIDDEIADQPALMFNDNLPVAKLNITEDMIHSDHMTLHDSIGTLVETPKRLRKSLGLGSCAASIDTLSPCESIASDDLMMDFDHSQSSGIDDSTDRLNESSALHSLDEATLRSELELQNVGIAREWSSLLGAHSQRDSPSSVVRTNNFIRSRTNTPSSVPDSPRLLNRPRTTAAHSPLLRAARTTHGSPANYDSDDPTAHEIIEIKSLVLKLQSVLQEKEPLNPFDNQAAVLKNGLCNGLSGQPSLESMECGSEHDGPTSMQIADLQKQVLFLQTQLEDRDRTVHQLQGKVAKFSLSAQLRDADRDSADVCNAATQTDRVRPISAGPSLLQSLPTDGSMGPLVSANEYTRRSRPQTMADTQHLALTTRSPPLKLWRKPGEPPPPPARFAAPAVSASAGHQRSHSRPRVTLTPF